jgi:hypothetical protein
MPLPGWTIEAVEVLLSIREASTHLVSVRHEVACVEWALRDRRLVGGDVDD